jgi:hypothetical protein
MKVNMKIKRKTNDNDITNLMNGRYKKALRESRISWILSWFSK